MFIKDHYFSVEFSLYAERHFCKDFLKKYKVRKWNETRDTIVNTLKRAFFAQQTSLIDVLSFSQENSIGIFKYDFKVSGTNFPPKTSGNRVIFSLCNNTATITILLVYGKDHCNKNMSETKWVNEQIKKL